MVERAPARAAGRPRTEHPRQARVVIGAAALSLMGLLAALIDPRGVKLLRKLQGELRRQEQANARLQQQNAELEVAVKALRDERGPAAERAVREVLGLVKDGEVIFKFE